MTDDSGSPQGSADQKVAELERVADDTRNKISAIVAAQRAGRHQTILATIVIIVIILVFGAKTYSKMKDNFARERFQTIVEQRGPQLMDDAKRALEKARDAVLPVYKEEAMSRFKSSGPVVLDKAKVHLSNLPEELRDDLEQRLDRSVNKAKEAITAHLQERFEGISPETMKGYIDQLHGKLASKENAMLDKMTGIFNKERQRVKKIMVQLPVAPTEGVDERDLDLALLKAALDYASFEVDMVGTDDALDLANLGKIISP